MLGDAATLTKNCDDLRSLINNSIERKCFFEKTVVAKEMQEQTPDQMAPSKQNPRSMPCRYFNGKQDSCKKGNTCFFMHNVEREQKTYKDKPAALQSLKGRVQPPCRYFNGKPGSCSKDSHCQFLMKNLIIITIVR